MAKSALAEKTQGTALAIATAFEEDASSSFAGMNQDDFALPFLRLLTNTSPEVGEIDGALPGMIYNSVTGQLYDGKKGITVIPCAYIRQYIEWAPRTSTRQRPTSSPARIASRARTRITWTTATTSRTLPITT